MLPSASLHQHFISASIITVDHISSKSDYERAEILLKRIFDELKTGHTQSFYRMLEIMKAHGSESLIELADKITQSDELPRSELGAVMLASKVPSIVI